MSRQQRIALVVAAVVVAVAAFLVLRPSDDNNDKNASSTTPAQTTPGSTSTTPATTAKPKIPVQRVKIANAKPVGGIKKITVKKGDRVVLLVTSADTSDEVHLHGYDLHGDLAPGKPVKLSFKANIEGIFEAELESRKEQIVELKVEP